MLDFMRVLGTDGQNRAAGPSLADGEQVPGVLNALHRVGTSVLKLDAGAGDEVDDSAGCQDFTYCCLGCHARGKVPSDAGEVVSFQLHLTCV